MSFDELSTEIEKYHRLRIEEKDQLHRAYRLAEQVHRDQKRVNGQDYFQQIYETAFALASWGVDCATVTAALVDEAIQQEKWALKYVQTNFSKQVVGTLTSRHPQIFQKQKNRVPTKTLHALTAKVLSQKELVDFAELHLVTDDRVGVMKDITGLIAQQKINILSLKSQPLRLTEKTDIIVKLESNNQTKIDILIKKLHHLKAVRTIEQLPSKV